MYEDIRTWCKSCEQCQRERGVTGVTSYARTEFYSRPFRVLQYDIVKCREETECGNQYILTCICCFSRWCWLMPISNKEATTVAFCLFTLVFLGLALFPTVMRSDNAKEFTGEVSRELNRLLGISHITGSTYHPQSQGMVESMHKTINAIVRGLVEGRAHEWEASMPYAQFILRIMPMKVLGGRSPYEIVLGIKPKLPQSLLGGHSVLDQSTDDYVDKLVKHFREVYAELERKFKEHEEDIMGRGSGAQSAQIKLGDLVLLRREPSVKREGALRFQERVHPDIFRVVGGGHPTFHLQTVGNPEKPVPCKQPVSCVNLIRLDMPELELNPDQPREIEILPAGADVVTGWVKYRIERYSVDGSVKARNVERPAKVEWYDLSRERYRWVQG